MILSVLVLVVSSALFFFYIQAFCEKALRREFSRAYFQDVVQAIQLEYPSLLDATAPKASQNYSDARLALECDFVTLSYLLENGDRTRRPLPRREKVLLLYFRFLLFCLPIRHAFKLREKEAVSKLATILQYFANSVGESLSISSLGNAQSDPRS